MGQKGEGRHCKGEQWKGRMEPRGVGMGWLCMAVLCSGAGEWGSGGLPPSMGLGEEEEEEEGAM